MKLVEFNKNILIAWGDAAAPQLEVKEGMKLELSDEQLRQINPEHYKVIGEVERDASQDIEGAGKSGDADNGKGDGKVRNPFPIGKKGD